MKKNIVFILIIFLVISFSACAGSNNAIKESDVLRIGLLPDDSSIPIMIAEELGYFEEAGIDIELILFRSAIDRDSAIQANELDGVSTDVLSLGLFKEGGIPAYAVAQTDGTYSLVVNDSAGISQMNDLSGKSIGLSFNTLMEYLLDVALNYNDMDANKVNKVSIPSIPARLEMLNSGQIDGATLPEPLASGAVDNGAKSLMLNRDFDTYPGILMVTKSYIDNNPDAFKAFSKAYNDAVDYINKAEQEEYFSIIKEKLAFPEGSEDYYTVKEYQHMILPDEKEIEKGMKWLFEKELISEEYSYDELIVDVI